MPSYSLNTKIHYYVEERLVEKPSEVNFAWIFDNVSDAQECLLDYVRVHGEERLYTAYFTVD